MKRLTLTASLILVLPLTSQADWTQISARDFTMQDPPVSESSVEKAEVDIMFDLQNRRTEAECAMAEKQQSPTFDAFYKKSGLFTAEEYAKIQRPLMQASSLASKISDSFKDHYHRPRPYSDYSRLRPCIPPPGGSKSYPSMHAAVSMTDACIMAAIFPERAQQILTYGDRLGTLRTVVGVHYPSDVAAGKILGEQICKALLADPSYTKLLPHN
ncbi:phosphatase PAP2 family protein [Bdellovibrio sp. KM01]|uniref:phosphatase PAP2 family protein n=1 Tax=Bdellovibrio sp. KM01 TaxID=2748865 RepID=UPI0015E9EF57|nr:phosphatase PAP2 family protein [Bdellovibrio sp. KM01]QLY24044.1 phosphatase PAP2 family protein [Bdellovibrio sp. KM01]